jgi:hypothetical protein
VLQPLPVLDEEFLDTIDEIATNLAEIAPFITDTVTARGEVPDVCELLAENQEMVGTVITAVQNIDKVGKVLKLAGSVLNAIGKTRIAGRVGIWGWAGISYSGGHLERFGGHLESLGNRLSPIADKAEKKLQYCILKINQQHILEMVESNHQEILSAMKSRGPDLDNDQDVDLNDFASFQVAFNGPSAQNRHRIAAQTAK